MRMNDRTPIGSGLLVLSGLFLGAAFAAVLRGGLQWGTVGEWVGGIGALFAGVVALYLERNSANRLLRRETERFAVSAARIAPRLLSLADRLEGMQEAVRGRAPERRTELLVEFAASHLVYGSLDRLLELRAELPNLPGSSAVALEGILTRVTTLQDVINFMLEVEPQATSRRRRSDARFQQSVLELCGVVVVRARALADEMEKVATSV